MNVFTIPQSNYIIGSALNFCMNGMEKKTVLASLITINNIIAFYLIQPEETDSRVAVGLAASAGAYVMTEAAFSIAKKTKAMAMNHLMGIQPDDKGVTIQDGQNEVFESSSDSVSESERERIVSNLAEAYKQLPPQWQEAFKTAFADVEKKTAFAEVDKEIAFAEVDKEKDV